MSATPPNSPSTLPNGVKNFLIGFFVLAGIVAFGVMFAYGMVQTWKAPAKTPPAYSEPFLYIATGLAALIGGIVAVGFGQKPPAQPQSPPGVSVDATKKPPGSSPGSVDISLLALNINGLMRFLFYPSVHINWLALFASVYAVVYVFWGAAAVFTWLVCPSETPDLIKNLATTFIGMAFPIIASFFGGQATTT